MSDYQLRAIEPMLAAIRPPQVLDYRPYLDTSRYRWDPRRDARSFHMCRVWRDDETKFPGDMWIAFDAVRVPRRRPATTSYTKNSSARTPPCVDYSS